MKGGREVEVVLEGDARSREELGWNSFESFSARVSFKRAFARKVRKAD